MCVLLFNQIALFSNIFLFIFSSYFRFHFDEFNLNIYVCLCNEKSCFMIKKNKLFSWKQRFVQDSHNVRACWLSFDAAFQFFLKSCFLHAFGVCDCHFLLKLRDTWLLYAHYIRSKQLRNEKAKKFSENFSVLTTQNDFIWLNSNFRFLAVYAFV